MNKIMKKVISLICAITMVGSGWAINPNKVVADISGVMPAPNEEGYNTCTLDTNVSLGSWCYYIGKWAGASAMYRGGKDLNDFSLKILTNNHDEWGVQAYTYNIPVTAGTEYEYSITLNSDTAGASVLLKEDSGIGDLQWMTLSEGDNVFEGSFTANDDAVKMFFKLDMLTPGTTVSVTSFSLEEAGNESTGVEVKAPTDVELYNFYASGLGYRVDFTEVEDAVSYNVYVDDSAAVANVSKSGEYVNASTFSKYADNGLHSVYLKAVDADGNESGKSNKAKVRITTLTNSDTDPKDITRIYVVTNQGTKGGADITKADKTSSSLTIISGDSAINTSIDSGTIKRRGNSTSLADKPAYNISFNSKKEVIEGAAKGKKWSLLANAYEKTMLRSKLAMDFGHVLGNVATPQQYYVDLYIDGEYKGTYLMSEPADNERSGVEMDDSDDGIDIMFELESERFEDDQTYYTTELGVRLVTNEPEGLDKNTERYRYWVNTLSSFEKALKNTSSNAVFDYIDMDSFVDMYIANEYFKTVDFGYSSVKYYITYDENNIPTIHAGALWDFDLSSGNCTVADIRSHTGLRGQQVNGWFGYLMQNQTFKNAVIKKFEKLQPQIQNIYSANELGDSQINQLLDIMGASKDRNYSPKNKGGAGWSESEVDSAEWNIYPYSYGTIEPYSKYTYKQHIEFLTNWLHDRNVWLCETWGIEYDYEIEEIPTTEAPTTKVPTTQAPTTEAPTTEDPTTKPNVEVPSAVVGLTWAGNKNLPYYWAWQQSKNAKSYNVYINGNLITSVAGLAVNLEAHASMFAEPGEYTIGVTAVNEGGESSMSTVVYIVEGKETTPAPTTEVPTTQVPTTEVPTTEVPTTEIPTTEVPTTEVPTTEVPTTEVSTTEVPTAEVLTTEAPTTEALTTELLTTESPGTDATTEIITTVISTEETTIEKQTTTFVSKENKVKRPGKVKIKKATKKKLSLKKISVRFKKVSGAKGYQIKVYKKIKYAKKNKKAIYKKNVKKVKVTIKSKKFRNKKKLFIKVRAYVFNADGSKKYGKWSKVRKVKITKK